LFVTIYGDGITIAQDNIERLRYKE